MARGGGDVFEALERWESTGLLDPGRAGALRTEALAHARRSGRRFSQYALAAAGGLVLLLAAGVLADWLWPLMGVGARSFLLAVVGLAVHALGLRMEVRERWLPASWLLQTSGLLVLLGAFAYSSERWPDATLGGLVSGLLSLVVPVLVVPRALGRNPVMPAVHLVVGLGFIAVFLDRATSLDTDGILWVLDAVLLLAAALLAVELRRVRDPEAAEWRLVAFATAAYAGALLAFLTAVGPLGWEEDALWALDAWVALATALTLAGIHRAPPWLRRDWYERQLGACVVMAVVLAFATCGALLDWGAAPTALVAGAVGAGALTYGILLNATTVVRAGALGVVAAAWYFGVQRAGALGAALALAFTAGLLFWLSVRVGHEDGPGG